MTVQPSPSDSTTSYDLSLTEADDKYTYHGTRTKTSNSYVLIFDPDRQVYVLHKVDSSLDANLTQVPWGQDAASLRETYPQLSATNSPRQRPAQDVQRKLGRSPRPQYDPTIGKRRKVERKIEAPRKAKPEPIRKAVEPEATPVEREEEDDDGGLTIEYPGGSESTRGKISTPLVQLSYSEAESEEESDGEDIYDADRNRDVEVLELPSPVGRAQDLDADADDDEEEDEEEEEEEEFATEGAHGEEELDLLSAAFHEALTQTEAEQEKALAQEAEAALVGSARADESSESEEE